MVDTIEELARFLPTLQRAEWVAVDTEADSLHAYPEKVCLIQISTVDGDRLIDPLAGFSLDDLLEALGGHRLIMHGADYDLRLLRKHHEFVPSSIFDTMLAARLLGHKHFGLGSLVETHLGVKLEKGSQKANWAVRPLSERLVKYARNDTHYLKPLSDRLEAELRQFGRLSWHQEWCDRLIKESTQPVRVDQNMVWRMKGSNRLGRHELAILREIWSWREKEAIAANRPPFFVLSHDLALNLSIAAAAGKPFEKLIPGHLSDRRRGGLSKAIYHGLKLPPDQYPKPLTHYVRRPGEAERKRYAELQKRRDRKASELNLDPTVIASRSVISDLAHDWDKYAPELMNWQRTLLE